MVYNYINNEYFVTSKLELVSNSMEDYFYNIINKKEFKGLVKWTNMLLGELAATGIQNFKNRSIKDFMTVNMLF